MSAAVCFKTSAIQPAQSQKQGTKDNINIILLVRVSCRHSRPLCPDAQGSRSYSLSPGPQENPLFGANINDFRRGRPRPERISKNFVQKKSALTFRKIPTPIKIKSALLKTRNFLGMGIFQQWGFYSKPKNSRHPYNWHCHFRPLNYGRKN